MDAPGHGPSMGICGAFAHPAMSPRLLPVALHGTLPSARSHLAPSHVSPVACAPGKNCTVPTVSPATPTPTQTPNFNRGDQK